MMTQALLIVAALATPPATGQDAGWISGATPSAAIPKTDLPEPEGPPSLWVRADHALLSIPITVRVEYHKTIGWHLVIPPHAPRHYATRVLHEADRLGVTVWDQRFPTDEDHPPVAYATRPLPSGELCGPETQGTDGGMGSGGRTKPILLRHCAEGLVIWYPNDWVRLERYPAAEPSFEPAGHAHPWENMAYTDQAWVWEGRLLHPLGIAAMATVVRLDAGDQITLRMYQVTAGYVGCRCPVLQGYTVRPGDWDFNGQVDSADISGFLAEWAAPPLVEDARHQGDFNGDGLVDAADIAAFVAAWGAM